MPIRAGSSGCAFTAAGRSPARATNPRAATARRKAPAGPSRRRLPRRRKTQLRRRPPPPTRRLIPPAPATRRGREAEPHPSLDHSRLGLAAGRDRVRRRRRVGAGAGAVQCLAGAVPDLPGAGLADRRRRRGPLGRRARRRPPPAGGSASAISSPASTGSATPSWSTRETFGWLHAVRGAGAAGLSGPVHRARLRAGAAGSGRRGFVRILALRGRADRQRMAARPSCSPAFRGTRSAMR